MTEPPHAPAGGADSDPEAERRGVGPCARIVRRADPDRFLSAIAAPAAARPALFALYALNAEVAKVRDVVSEAMLGDIRLQWWREAVEECFAGRPRRHEVVRALADAVAAARPDPALFEALIDARARDLDDAPIESLADYEAYARATSGGVIRLAVQMLGLAETAESVAAAEHLGIGYALIGHVRALPYSLAQRRTLLPRAVLRGAGADEALLYKAKPAAEIARGAATLLDLADAHLKAARRARGAVPKKAAPAFLGARLAASHLAQLRRAGCDPFDGRLAHPPPWRALSLAWGARTGRW
ncbi:MAG: squalene/phytoene synthase family protein [Alphaproteobacteria bacterium]|nr:squalene/phytoene synthase family protein [Alphaproteobacteria bacterium]